jgi:hypothetical protein
LALEDLGLGQQQTSTLPKGKILAPLELFALAEGVARKKRTLPLAALSPLRAEGREVVRLGLRLLAELLLELLVRVTTEEFGGLFLPATDGLLEQAEAESLLPAVTLETFLRGQEVTALLVA